MLKKIIDVSIIFISILCFIWAYKIISAKSHTDKVMCKQVEEKKFNIKFSSLRPFKAYNSTIIGGIFPKENTDIKDKQIDVKLNFYLMGTAVVGDKKSAIFYFKKDRRCYPYKVGDEIDGWKIDDILKGEVVLESNGKKNNIKITGEKVACSRMRMTKVDLKANAIMLDSLGGSVPLKNNKKTSNKRPQIKKTTSTSKPKIIRPKSKSRRSKPPKNPFLELLNRIKKEKKNRKTPSTARNPFLELLKQQRNR